MGDPFPARLAGDVAPLNTYFGWRSAIPLRKPAGLWAFAFAALHLIFTLFDNLALNMNFLLFPLAQFVIIGIAGFVILAAMALTSTRWAQRSFFMPCRPIRNAPPSTILTV
jgi:sulfoxide reductase heme-binding subunit YedZ